MKKFLLGVTAFTLILTSCQKNEVVDDVNAGKNQLGFAVYQGRASRASELTNALLKVKDVNFPIYAYKGAQNEAKELYFKEVLTYANPIADKWNTSIPRFLTDSKPLQFFAYYANGTEPIATAGEINGAVYGAPANNTTAYPTLEYTIQEDGKVSDLVAASIKDHAGTAVAIEFKHILSQINFGVRGFYGAKIKISNIVINKVCNEGTFSYDPAKWEWDNTGKTVDSDYEYTFAGGANAAASTFTTPGGIKTGEKWGDGDTEGDNLYILGDGGKWGPGSGATAANVRYATAAGNNAIVKGEEIIAGTTTPLNNALMLMPQALKAGVDEAFVTFDYSIQDLEGKYVIGENTLKEGRFDLNLNGTAGNDYADKWQPNKRYVYIIDFTGYLTGQLLSFTVDVDSNEWENYDKPGDGTVDLESVGEPLFAEVLKLTDGGTINVLPAGKTGHVFSDITWDWSDYSMPATFIQGNTFTVTFTGVKFNGHKVTVKAPKNFTVTGGAGADTNEADATHTTLTFTKN